MHTPSVPNPMSYASKQIKRRKKQGALGMVLLECSFLKQGGSRDSELQSDVWCGKAQLHTVVYSG